MIATIRNGIAALACVLLSTAALAQNGDISVQKTGPATTTAGSNVTYTITLTNVGSDPVNTITLTDQIPSVFQGQQIYSMTFVSMTTDPNFGCGTPMVGAGGTITCTGAMLAAGGTATFTVTLNVPANTPPGVQFANVATASAADDVNEENNSGVVVTTIPAPSADIGVNKSAATKAAADTDIVYTVTVLNGGPDTASGLNVSDTLPGNLTFVSFSQSGTGLTCTTPTVGTGGTVNCSAASYPAGSTTTLTITAHVPPGTIAHVPPDSPAGTDYDNVATATTTSLDPNSENDTAQARTIVVEAVDVAITKNGPASVGAGANIAYTLTITNNGPGAASNVRLSDAIPQNASLVTFTRDNGPAANCSITSVIDCSYTTLASGASAQFTLTLQAGSSGTVVNTASVSTDNVDSNNANNTATVTTTITQVADVSVQKTGPMSVVAGNNVTYQITVVNNGPSPAANVALTDTFPANTTFVSIAQNTGPAFNCPAPAPGLNCTIASLASGAQATFTLVLAVAASAPAGPLMNTANVSAAVTDNVPGNNQSPSTVNVTTLADVVVNKTGPASVTAGSTVTYTITFANTGPSDAAAANLDDFIALGTTFVSFTQNSGPAFTCTTPAVGAPQGPNTKVNCTRPSLAAGATATFTMVLNVLPDKTGTLSNIAMGGTSTAESSFLNNIGSTTANVVASSDVAVAKTAAATVNGGADLTWTITVINNGPSTATGVTLADTLPAGTTFASLTQNTGPAFTCTAPAVNAAGAVNCSIATLANAATATFTLVVNVLPATTGTIANTATVSAATADAVNANNSMTASTAIGAFADLSLTKTGPATVTASQNATYTVVVNNAGPSNAVNATMTDTLPANTTFVSATQKSGPAFACTTPAVGGTGTVSCTIASLANGASATFEIVLKIVPTATGSVSNSASVTSATADPTPGNASAAAAAAIALAPTDLSVEKTAAFDPAAATKAITWTIIVRNLGPGVANNVIATDVLQAGWALNSVTSTQGTCTGNPTITCAIGVLASGAAATVTLAVTLPSEQTTAINTVTAATDNPDTNAANNTATSYVQFAPRLIPTLSWSGMLLIILALAALGTMVLSRKRNGAG